MQVTYENGADSKMKDSKDEFRLDSETSSSMISSQLTAYHELQSRAKSIVRITFALTSIVLAVISSDIVNLSNFNVPEAQDFETPLTVGIGLISDTIAVCLIISFFWAYLRSTQLSLGTWICSGYSDCVN